MMHKNEHLYVEKRLKPGWYMYWEQQTYRIIPPDKEDPLTLYAENTTTAEVRSFSFTALWCSDHDENGPIFAPTLEQLRREIDSCFPVFNIAPTSQIPDKNMAKAEFMLTAIEQIKKLVPVAEAQLEKEHKAKTQRGESRKKATNTEILRAACALLKPKSIKLSTFYKYQHCIKVHHAERSAIAASFRRSTYRQTKLDKATRHFLDTIIPLYCGRKRPGDIYNLGESALEYRTQGLWLDPEKCKGQIPENMISELKQVLDRKLPMQALLENENKKALLSKIEMPARGLFYNYHHWFLAQPDQGRKALNDRYGEGTWESYFAIFDSFAYRATFPLQYVFADHYLLDVFSVDKTTRSKLDRLWLTVLIDVYTRCILVLQSHL